MPEPIVEKPIRQGVQKSVGADTLLSLDQAAMCLGMSRRSFYRRREKLVAAGLKQIRDGDRYKYPASSVNQFITRSTGMETMLDRRKQ
jgi:predicted DNA-binding transcriptional regulator AlpA